MVCVASLDRTRATLARGQGSRDDHPDSEKPLFKMRLPRQQHDTLSFLTALCRPICARVTAHSDYRMPSRKQELPCDRESVSPAVSTEGTFAARFRVMGIVLLGMIASAQAFHTPIPARHGYRGDKR